MPHTNEVTGERCIRSALPCLYTPPPQRKAPYLPVHLSVDEVYFHMINLLSFYLQWWYLYFTQMLPMTHTLLLVFGLKVKVKFRGWTLHCSYMITLLAFDLQWWYLTCNLWPEKDPFLFLVQRSRSNFASFQNNNYIMYEPIMMILHTSCPWLKKTLIDYGSKGQGHHKILNVLPQKLSPWGLQLHFDKTSTSYVSWDF